MNVPNQSLRKGLLTINDYKRSAKRKLPKSVWDFIAGGSGSETTIKDNLRAFGAVELRPRVLNAVTKVDMTVEVFGQTWAAPIAVAPMALHTMVHPEGEGATVLGAGRVGLPVVASFLSGRTFRDIAASARSPVWLQLYCLRDRAEAIRIIRSAAAANFEAIVLTVDTPRMAFRRRDARNQFTLPAGVVPANLGRGFESPVLHAAATFDPAANWGVIDWLRSVSSLPIVVKGILTAEDALHAVDCGVNGIVVSNHGGRQLDGVTPSLGALGEVLEAVGGRCLVFLDGGIRRGRDVLVALALGADSVMVGRPVMYGLAVAGEDGVEEVLRMLMEELEEAMVLCGVATMSEVAPDLVVRGETPIATDDGMRGQATFGRGQGREGRITGQVDALLSETDLHSSLSDPVLTTMNFLNEVTERYPDAISFAPGRPCGADIGVEDIFRYLRAYKDHLEEEGWSADSVHSCFYQYGPTAGRIRELVAATLRIDEGIEVRPESVVITTGCQEAMLLTLRALARDSSDVILVTSPCYTGITGAARLLDIPIVAVAEAEVGISCRVIMDAVGKQRAMGRRPRAIYVMPDQANPSGNTMAIEVRRELLERAQELNIFVIEDGPYRLISPGPRLPTLKALDQTQRVIHLGSFSKSGFPGARVGFVVADQRVGHLSGPATLLATELTKLKSMVTLNTSALGQAAIAGMLLEGGNSLEARNVTVREHYNRGLKRTLDELRRRFENKADQWSTVRWNSPTGGFFVSLEVPFVVDDEALVRSAEQWGVIWTPMSYFYPGRKGGHRELRLAFSSLSEAEIEEGIGRLATFVASESERCRADD